MALDQSLRSAGRRGLYASVALGLSAAVGVSQILAHVWQHRLWARVQEARPEDLEAYTCGMRGVALALVQALRQIGLLGLSMIPMILFLVWFHRAMRIGHELQDEVALPRPGQAVASFFIPFINLVRPVTYLSDLHRALWPGQLPPVVTYVDNPTADYRSPAREEVVQTWSPVSAPIGWWWLCYLLPSLQRLFSEADVSARSYLTITIVFTGVRVIADILGILVIHGINARAVELARRDAAMVAAGGPRYVGCNACGATVRVDTGDHFCDRCGTGLAHRARS